MNFSFGRVAIVAAAAFGIAGISLAAAPEAQNPGQSQTQATPKGWNYEIVNGQRVPKGDRVTNPDGSWRETFRQGTCTTVKEKSAAGEYKETRNCG